MPTPPLSPGVIAETVRRVEDELRAGYRPMGMAGSGFGAIRAAGEKAVLDGFIRTTSAFETRVKACMSSGHEPDWALYRPARYQQPVSCYALRYGFNERLGNRRADRIAVGAELAHSGGNP